MEEKEFSTAAFATRTERFGGHNPGVNGLHVIGLDMGYSGIKCFHGNGHFCFPNFCTKMEGEQFGRLGKRDIVYSEGSERWMVGGMAVRSLSGDAAVTEDAFFGRTHYLRREFVVEFRTALALALWDIDTDGHDVVIQTGLPPAYMVADEPYLRRVIEGNHKFSVEIGTQKRSFDITIDSSRVNIMNQPMGTFWSTVIGPDGRMTKAVSELSNTSFLIFDAGYVTLDTFLVRGNEIVKRDSDPNLGMKRVLTVARDMLLKETGATVTLPAMQEALRTGHVRKVDLVTVTETEIDISGYVKKANELVREEAFEYIRPNIADIRYLIMTGGTGDAWRPYFEQKLSGIGTVRVLAGGGAGIPGFYANSRGYYMYCVTQLNTQRATQLKKGQA